MARESSLRDRVLSWLNSWTDTRAKKYHGSAFTESGHPDVYGCCRGVFFAVELKRPGEKATALQLERIDEWRRCGGVAIVADELGTVIDMIESIRQQRKVWR